MVLFDARSLPDSTVIEGDICIVGAGAAGIAAAMEFVNTPHTVILLESGGLGFDRSVQSLYAGHSTGRPILPLEGTRRRQFGGTTHTWFGRCRPLDEIDFEKRSWIADSGWPISRSDLDPYYARAQRLLELDEYDYSAARWSEDGSEAPALHSAGLETKIFQFSPPSNFADLYLGHLRQARNIRIYLFADAARIILNRDGRSANCIQAMTLGRRQLRFKAKIHILAASALEVTRLLLVSRDRHADGIGNGHDLVGRYFMEHLSGFCGMLAQAPQALPPGYFKLDYEGEQKNLGVTKAIGIPEASMREQSLLNAAAFFVKRPAYKSADVYYSKRMASLLEFKPARVHKEMLAPFQLMQRAGRGLKQAGVALPLLLGRVSHVLNPSFFWGLQIQLETVPNAESRVTLSEQKDELGVEQINVHWQTTRQDVESYQRVEQLLRDGLRKLGLATRRFAHELDADGWPVSMTPSKHHMGTTRMHASPQQGVVDEHCRVHGLANLYIAGSSVFPTSGMANPTLTIVALSIRLADHVKKKLVA